MSIFLALKQIVDVLYEFKVLDYAMVLLAIAMIGYGFIKFKCYEGIKNKASLCDFAVAGLGLVYLLSFLRNTAATSQILKIESAFLVYFLGRIFGRSFALHVRMVEEHKKEYGIKVLLLVSYLLIYLNFFYKLYVQLMWIVQRVYVGNPNFSVKSDGALYYYKTDMAVGMIIAVIFVYAFGKNAVLKWITIVPIGSFMLFYKTLARAGQCILILEYVLILVMELYRRGVLKKPVRLRTKPMTVAVFALLPIFFVFIQCYPPLKSSLEDIGLTKEQLRALEKVFHSRHLIWWDAISYYVQQPFLTRLFGIDLISETLHNSLGDRFHNLYFKQIYSIGYLGCYLYATVLCFLLKVISNGTRRQGTVKYLGVALWIMFLIMSVSMEGLEYTQMSWYPFLLLGCLVTLDRNRDCAI